MAATATRRAEFLMTLAYATDLATGQSRDFALRSCVLAMRFADVLRLDTEARRAVFHQALLRYIGCNADTHRLATAFGDEIALRRDLARIDIGDKSQLGATIARGNTARPVALTPRETEVLQLIAAGHAAKEAARLLDIAPRTADNHIQNLHAKIGVSTRAGAALHALERGLARSGNFAA